MFVRSPHHILGCQESERFAETACSSTGEHSADNRATKVRLLLGRLAMRIGIEVLAAERPALNRVVRVRAPPVPFRCRHRSSSGEDTAPVMRLRGFESHSVLSAL
jgi:hypothetical protein